MTKCMQDLGGDVIYLLGGYDVDTLNTPMNIIGQRKWEYAAIEYWLVDIPALSEIVANDRKRKHDMLHLALAAVHQHFSKCKWRDLPGKFPPWQTVFYYVHCWRREGIYDSIIKTSAHYVHND